MAFYYNLSPIISGDFVIESLKSICEAFIVGLDIAGIHSIKYNQGHKLDKRKSKVITDGRGTNMYLDIVGLPQLTRNVSETQLLALKNAGNSPNFFFGYKAFSLYLFPPFLI